MTPEARFARRVDGFLSSLNCLVYNINMMSQIGVPDRIGCVRGRFFAMEIKKSRAASNKKSSTIALQHYNIEKIQANGGFATFVYPENFSQVKKDFLQYIDDSQ